MKISKKTAVVAALVLGIGAPASAFVLPPFIPDICAYGSCIQFTHSALLAQVQQLYQQATSLQNQARNLSSIGNVARQNIGQNIGSLTSSRSPGTAGDDAATQVLSQAPGAADTVAKTNAQAQGADGAQAQGQVGNLYLSTIASETVKGNALAAEEQSQKKNEAAAESAGMAQLFSGSAPAADMP